ncbi:MAG: glycosyltransferase family A protein [Candidatus Kapabacteria bacterium]|jgi:glycosyltransferase involved in cell wall biosynthesis|nr:glycosyltransferase family A protein [Candidatus Kapabacteria bacterium]
MTKSISIITPHYNDIEGVLNIKKYLSQQTSTAWEWIIVDDCSDQEIQSWLASIASDSDNIHVILNTAKTNASYCRNMGADKARFDLLIFLDADDTILPDFVRNRLIDVSDFVVFQRMNIQNGETLRPNNAITQDFLEHFLSAKFCWQTSCVLWDKNFFQKIGKFDDKLKLLQDVEISIRSMFESSDYKVITDNEVDFYYQVQPINIKKRTLQKVSESSVYLIHKISKQYTLTTLQKRYLTCYYFLCVRYFVMDVNASTFKIIKHTLKEFYKNRCINFSEYVFGRLSLKVFQYKIINKNLFIKTNRKVFKTNRVFNYFS